MKKRGQVAIFALLGLVMLIIVSFMLILVTTVNTAELEQRAREAVRDYMATSPINFYVNTCLEQATQEALQEFSQQGGTFFQHQQGPFQLGQEGITHIPYQINDDLTVNVTYGIIRPYLTPPPQNYLPQEICSAIKANPPEYPNLQTNFETMNRVDYHLKNISCPNIQYSAGGYMGINILPRMCLVNGPNWANIQSPTGPALALGCPGIIFPSGSLQRNHSVDIILSQRILNKTIECIDFEIFENMDGDNISFVENLPKNVTIIYESEGFQVNLNLPFRVALQGYVPVFTSFSFQHNSNIRLPEILRYLYELLREDTINPNFNIEQQYQTLTLANRPLFKEGFELEIINFTEQDEVLSYRWDRILKLTDTRSLLFGENFTFYTAIQNRNPVLEYINPSPHPVVNIIVYEGDQILIIPNARDPDNRLLNYNYSGWRETNNSVLLLQGEGCSLPFSSVQDIRQCMQITSCNDCFNWTQSEQFQETSRLANITTNTGEWGLHTVRVIVRDPSGREDFQDVQILVIDSITIEVEIGNLYPQTDTNLSVENPILFDASASSLPQLIEGEASSFNWTITNQTGNVIFQSQQSSFQLTLPPNPNILNIHKEQIIFPGDYTLRLEIGFQPQDSLVPAGMVYEDFEFTVLQCLNHQNSNNPPFPYNLAGTNPFLADHACCQNNQLQSPSDTCFELTRWGTISQLNQTANQNANREAQQITNQIQPFDIERRFTVGSNNYPSTQNIPMTNLNDVFRLEFTRKCDGTRGNVCAGDINIQITRTAQCNYEPSQQNKQCQGPSSIISSSNNVICENYVNRYFDLEELTIKTGTCTDIPALSRANSIDGYDNNEGPHWCLGANCRNGECKSTIGVSCQCIFTEQSSAQCDNENNVLRENTLCRFGCNQVSCQFQNTISLPCEGNSCFRNAYESFGPSCYYNVQCTTNPSEHFTRIECGELGPFTDPSTGIEYCRWIHPTNNPCGSSPTNGCNVNTDPRPPSTNVQCNNNAGWITTGPSPMP